MATPIKDTPVLYGKDAERFERIIKENESKKVPAADYNRAKEAYKKIQVDFVMTKTIKAAATDSIVYTSLNDAKDMPKQKMVMAMVAGINGFCDCFRTIDPEQGGKEIFWLEEECREVDESEIIGWVNYPQYEAE